MRKFIALLGLLLVLSAPFAIAAPKDNAPTFGAAAYMPINSLSGLFRASVDYKANSGSGIISLTFANNQTATINIRTNVVTYKSISRTLHSGILRKGGNVFIPINELSIIFNDVGAKVPPGKALLPRRQDGNVPVAPISSTMNFARLPNAHTIYGNLQTDQPAVLLGRAGQVLTTLGSINANAEVLLVYRGKFLTGGYAIEVQSLSVVNEVLHIGVKLTNPAPGAMVTQAVAYPYDVVLLGGHVQFTSWQMNLGGSQAATGTIIDLP